MPFLVLQLFGIMLLSLQNLLFPSPGEEGGNADCLIILRRYLQAVLPTREGEKGWRCYSHKSLKHADGWLLDYEWVEKLASFASVQMGGEPGWVSLVHKYPGCWCSTEIGARVYERRCSVVFQSNWIFLTLTLFITLIILSRIIVWRRCSFAFEADWIFCLLLLSIHFEETFQNLHWNEWNVK